jgi:hypothetical protein
MSTRCLTLRPERVNQLNAVRHTFIAAAAATRSSAEASHGRLKRPCVILMSAGSPSHSTNSMMKRCGDGMVWPVQRWRHSLPRPIWT